ncbi:MAG: virulence RhuM family protein [Zoogloeaceae bacterium]|nr:virulence RhuM family protein [Zoogloeaceae bacterium]MCK6383522.1 virulence RhuM family protein [Rhodocyclaceae bacterium]
MSGKRPVSRSTVPESQERDGGEFLLYQTEDAQTRVQLRVSEGTVWMTQKQLAELYQVSVPAIVQHIRKVFAEGELTPEATVKEYLIVAPEAARTVERRIAHYRLEMVLAVGYRVRSHRGTQFRRWATEQLKSYLVKGFVLDDERFKRGDDTYFDELLARIRDIRSSEKMFWRKVLDIYATSIDYDPSTEASQTFFAMVQNKMHWAAHGHTAAELIALRADATAPNMGLTNWAAASKGGAMRKADVGVAKNYLNEDELATLNRIVNAYLEFAELQAQARRAMTMHAWIAKLDDFLRLSDREVLTHAGNISAELAQAKAEAEFSVFHQRQLVAPSRAERDFEASIGAQVKQLEKAGKKSKGKKE